MGKKRTGTGPADYLVGRGKPPRHTWWPPGQSANPGGRKKGSLNMKTLVGRVMYSEIILTEHGQQRSVTMAEAVILSAVKNGMSGDQRAIEFLIACSRLRTLGPKR